MVDPVKRRNGAATLHATTLGLFLAASSAPAPLYRSWQRDWGFSPLMLSVVFAVYAFALLAALLGGGGLSDQVGRRPVILAAIGGEVAAMLGFAFARDVDWLLAARVVQGISTGLAAAAVGAAILDADHARGPLLNAVVPMLGLGAGGLGSALIAHWVPWPAVFAILAALFVLQAVLTARAAETVTVRGGPIRLKPRVSVPAAARGALLAATPAAVALWALGGFSMSLLPSLLAVTLPGSGSLLGGVSVAMLTGSSSLAILLARRHDAATMLRAGSALMLPGMAGMLAGAHLSSLPVLLGGAVLAGLGFGAGWFGAVRSVLPLAAPAERSALMSAFYLECYLANALPVIAAGAAVRPLGLLRT
ncbi:MAG: MFS transporter, partial [Gluconacetobacter diazotrophicus]|nr:MFS transporter [Gluconacetobacter diazotrophicus]